MSLPLVLVPSPAPATVLDTLQDRFDLLLPWQQEDPDGALADRAAEIEAIANPGEGPVGKELMDRLPNLGLIAHFGVGYDTVDVHEAVRRGVVVTNVAGSNDEEVADTAMGLLLMTVRELPQAQEYLRAGRWHSGPYPLTRLSLQGRTMGLLGIGNIGRSIARRAEAFGVRIAYHARHERDLEYRYYPDLHGMARDVDVLVVATPGGASTRHLVDEEVLRALGPDGVLINIARGSVVDERALIRALSDGTIGAAGLDVYENEPDVPADLRELPNAVLLPHVGSASLPTRRQMAELGAANLESWFADRTVRTPVPEAQGIAAP